MKTEYMSDQTLFVNEECGDTMWNDENLNPPNSNDEKRLRLEGLIVESMQDLSTASIR